MSTWLYLRCDAHDPPLYSEDVGQHLYDLPDIGRYVTHRGVLAQENPFYDGTPESHFSGNAARFLNQHPRCPLTIEDEYGETHEADE